MGSALVQFWVSRNPYLVAEDEAINQLFIVDPARPLMKFLMVRHISGCFLWCQVRFAA